jgi:hypothetical protein
MFPYPVSFIGDSAGGTPFENLYSMAFDAVDDTIVVPYSSTLDVAGGDHSLSFWMKNSVGNVRVIMEKGANDELAALLINNKIYWGGANGYYGGTVSLVDGNWHHIVFVATGTTSEIFIDGSSVATGGDKTHAVLNTSDLNIGTRGGSYTYGGLLDEVAIFDYALSSSDVTSMYNSGVPNNLNDLSTAPVVWLRMGD